MVGNELTSQQLIWIIGRFRTVNSRMEAQQMVALLLIYQHKEISPTALGEKMGVTGAAATRNIYNLSKDKGKGVKGPGLVDIRENPMDRRYKIASLTSKGLRLIEEVLGRE